MHPKRGEISVRCFIRVGHIPSFKVCVFYLRSVNFDETGVKATLLVSECDFFFTKSVVSEDYLAQHLDLKTPFTLTNKNASA